ncbi:hypothetical protein [Micrococcus sp.]|uniref:hypothetical protein n=1 Tax=Micrococcus sp. TaxID=1271 RepID=UPI002A914D5E|nr:hypothetical protein [Micrococcus sp.]MDY6055650.1 hypothetical protein [Micrococcus sp.]
MRTDRNKSSWADAPVPVVGVTGPDDGLRSAWAGALARATAGVLLTADRFHADVDALPRTARLLAHVPAPAPTLVVVEVGAEHSMLDVIGECTDPQTGVRLMAAVLVADPDEAVARLDVGDARSVALLDAVEACTHHALTPGSDAALAVLAALQPTAVRVEGLPHLLGGPGTPLGLDGAERILGPLTELGAERDEAGWVRVLNDEWQPPAPLTGAACRPGHVTVFRHERTRPLHSRRWEALAHRWGGRVSEGVGLRVAGLCRIGTHPAATLRWDQAGRHLGLHVLAEDSLEVEPLAEGEPVPEPLCLGHDLAVFAWGEGWDEAAMRAELDAAAVTDEEFLAGPDAW